MGWQKLPVPERDILLCVVYDWSMYPRFILSIGSNLFGCNAKLAGSREERGGEDLSRSRADHRQTLICEGKKGKSKTMDALRSAITISTTGNSQALRRQDRHR